TELLIAAITPPEEVEKMMDVRGVMAAVGDMNAFMKFQAAKAMTDAAQAGGDTGGAMQTGLGAGLGMMMPGMIREAMSSPPAAAPVPPSPAAGPAKFCSDCGGKVEPT